MADEESEALFDPEQFLVTFPVWVLFNPRLADPNGGFPAEAVHRQVTSAENPQPGWVPIFTDWDLTVRFIMTHDPGACAVPVGPARLLELLRVQEHLGTPNVGFDPQDVAGGIRVVPTPVAVVIAALRGRA